MNEDQSLPVGKDISKLGELVLKTTDSGRRARVAFKSIPINVTFAFLPRQNVAPKKQFLTHPDGAELEPESPRTELQIAEAQIARGEISKIRIYNRTDCCAERLDDAKVEILNIDGSQRGLP